MPTTFNQLLSSNGQETAMTTTADIISAMPRDADELVPEVDDKKLREMYEKISKRKIPTGAIRRLGIIGTLHAKMGLAAAAYAFRKWIHPIEQRDKIRAEAYLSVAIQMLDTMSHLRGAIMKVGQMTANFPDIIPDEFTETLSQLHFQAPPMHFSLVREQIENELGGEVETRFAEFNSKAIAAASLGQVHQATLDSGRHVAVKIQYPGIARSIRSDLRNMSALMTPVSIGKHWKNMREQIDELKEVLSKETDYELEADNLRRARSLFSEDDQITIPAVHDQLSSRRVLTMDWVEGSNFEEFLATNPSQETRNHFARLLILAHSRLYYQQRSLYADPHPGNLLFGEDGQLGMIDFGCIRTFNDEEWSYLREADRVMDHGREGAIEHMRRGMELTDKDMANTELVDSIADWCDWVWYPNVTNEEYDFGNADSLREGIDAFKQISKYRPKSKPENLFLLRWTYAQRALLYRLKAKVNVFEIIQSERRAAGWQHRA